MPRIYPGPEVGATLGEWTILEVLPLNGGTQNKVLCRCACGLVRIVQWHRMRTGGSRSCGRQEQHGHPRHIHGQSRASLYTRWNSMTERCHNEKASSFETYGGRGIFVCEEWRADFLAFCTWAYANGYKPDLQIDRIDNDGPYSPENCRWVTRTENSRNKRSNLVLTAWGESKPVSAWAEDSRCHVGAGTLARRVRYGWGPERAIALPPGPNGHKQKAVSA